MATLRGAASNKVAADRLADFVQARLIEVIGPKLGSRHDAAQREGLVVSMLMGLVLTRKMDPVPLIADLPPADVAKIIPTKMSRFTVCPPSQRCFISWSQLWAGKTSEQAIPIQLQDVHTPGNYRTYAPLQHLDAFYEAFGIEDGDPMWLLAEERIDVW